MRLHTYLTGLITGCLMLLTTANAAAQNSLSFQQQSYPATEVWPFVCADYVLYGTAEVQIGKTPNGGILQISLPTDDPNAQISGTAYLDLEDGSTVVCLDKGYKQNQDRHTRTYYQFTAKEMNKLQKSNVLRLRFRVTTTTLRFGAQSGSFTAVNQKGYFSTLYGNTARMHPTAQAVNELYLPPSKP